MLLSPKKLTLYFMFAAICHFYQSKATVYYLQNIVSKKGAAHSPSSWNTNPSGGSTDATNFTTVNDTFIVPSAITDASFDGGSTTTFGTGVTLIVDGVILIPNSGSTRTLNINGTIIFTSSTSSQLSGGGGASKIIFNLNAGATLITANTNGVFSNTSGTNCSLYNIDNASPLSTSANYIFNGANQSFTGLPGTVNNLTCSGSGTKTATGAITVNGTLTIASGVTLNMGTYQLSGSSLATSGTGTFQTQNTTATPIPSGRTWSFTVQYNSSSAQTIVNGTYTNLNGTGGNRTLSGTINISETFTPGAGTYTITGSTVAFNGTSAQNIPGFTFNNLTIAGSGTKSLTGNVTVQATLTLNNNLAIQNNTLTLNGSLSGSSRLTANGTGSNLVIGAAVGTVNFDQTTPGTTNRLNNLTFSANVTLGDVLEVRGNITPTSGTLTTGGYLRLISDGSGTANLLAGSTGTISGNVLVQRHIPASQRSWRFLASPVASQTLLNWRDNIYITGPGTGNTVGTFNSNGFDATATNNPGVYTYDETVSGAFEQGWQTATNINNSITVGKGYRVFVRGDRSDLSRLTDISTPQNDVTLDLEGNISLGNVTMPVTFTASLNDDHDGWNLVGNPYPGVYDWNAYHDLGRSGNNGTHYQNISPIVWVWDAASKSYVSYNALSNEGTLTNGLIPSGAAFWVKAVTNATTSMTFVRNFLNGGTPSGVFKTNHNNSFRLKLRFDSLTSDVMIVKYINDATPESDAYDIPKLYGTVNISAYGNDQKQLTLSSRPVPGNNANDTIYLSVWGAQGQYTLTFDKEITSIFDKTVYLVDQFTNQIVDITANPNYSFSITANNQSQGNQRFYLVVQHSQTSLSVKLLSFGANITPDKKVELNWTTESEMNLQSYVVERSADGVSYESIAAVSPKGTMAGKAHYLAYDEQPRANNYYRLKWVEKDGNFDYSPVQYVALSGNEASVTLKLYPNPVVREVNIEQSTGIEQINVIDERGNTIINLTNIGAPAYKLDFSQFPSGFYFIKIKDAKGHWQTQGIIKE